MDGPSDHSAGHLEVDRLPDARIAVGDKRIPVGRILFWPLVTQVVPVDPVIPAVRQFDAVDILQRALRRDLDRQRVGRSLVHPSGDIEFVGGVHADDLVVARDQVAVQPDLGAVVDAGKLQHVRRVAGRCGECGAVPPVLLVEVLRDLVEQIGSVVEVRVGAVLLQGLQNGRRHSRDRMPAGCLVVRLGEGGPVCPDVACRDKAPALRQLNLSRRRPGLGEVREVRRTEKQQQGHREQDS